MKKPTILTIEQVRKVLVDNNISFEGDNDVFFVDETYACVSKSWLFKAFGPNWISVIRQYLGVKYTSQAYDCDNFARGAASWADILHVITPEHPKSGLAIGEFVYATDDGGAHAINIVICNDLEVVFFEPQTGTEAKISIFEKCNAINIRF